MRAKMPGVPFAFRMLALLIVVGGPAASAEDSPSGPGNDVPAKVTPAAIFVDQSLVLKRKFPDGAGPSGEAMLNDPKAAPPAAPTDPDHTSMHVRAAENLYPVNQDASPSTAILHQQMVQPGMTAPVTVPGTHR